ncbi:MAG: hypothetical protein M1826_007131 [Phylliscum demangeonii]|nr:MAG: hypothetical protein M1826_007131 [Phylliscum demangeonii]
MLQFDDLTAPLLVSPPVPTPYQQLRFGTFSVAPVQPAVIALLPHSSPNYAASGVRGQTLNGQNPTIDFAYPGSTLKSFDVSSFYFGCTLDTQVTAVPAIACTVQVTGKKAGTGATVGPKLVNFVPAGSVAGTGASLQTGMAKASLSDFTALSSVTLQVVLSSIPVAAQQTAVLYIDDFVHTNYQ